MCTPVRIHGHRQLFLDDYLIEACEGMRRRVCPVRKHEGNPVIRPEEDWEPSGYVGRGAFLFDEEEGIHKAWCSCHGAPRCEEPDSTTLTGALSYFTSEDGIHWERPELDLIQIGGRRTNVVALGFRSGLARAWPALNEPFGVVKDLDDPDPNRRYKMGYLYLVPDYRGPDADPFHPAEYRGLGVAFSPDGCRWTTLARAVTRATCDGFTHWCRDPRTGRWILFGRTKHIPPEMESRFGDLPGWRQAYWGRAVRRAESADFVHWTPDEGELCLAPDVEDGPYGEIYGMRVFPYEGLFVGLPQLFHNTPEDAHLEIQLAVSRDGRHFERLSDRSPFIPVGGVGEWDRFNNGNVQGEPVRVGDELRFYYGGRNARHSGAYRGDDNGVGILDCVSAVGLGTVKLDRFAAMEATFSGGTLRTKPLLWEGAALHVNAAVPFGRLEVALLGEDGHPVEGAAAVVMGEDSVDTPVPLPGVGATAGRPARLSFTLHNGRLFSFWVE